uniref:Uncharacterized protein n=1 Tax=Theropithecus gelada TaxID=9565 RepID=A0A8D2JWC5_THEGE
MNPNCHSSPPAPHQRMKPELQEESLQSSTMTAHLIHGHCEMLKWLLKQTLKALEKKTALSLSKIILREKNKLNVS